jgi:hypothetical protein
VLRWLSTLEAELGVALLERGPRSVRRQRMATVRHARVQRRSPTRKAGTRLMLTIILIVVVLLLLFGGFGYSRRGRRGI